MASQVSNEVQAKDMAGTRSRVASYTLRQLTVRAFVYSPRGKDKETLHGRCRALLFTKRP